MKKPSIHSSTDPFEININTEFLPEQSDPEHNQFAFAYHITITNKSEQTVQLLSRHWIISDGNKKVTEVKGDGVVGEQPIINSEESFSYTSGVLLETPIGSMRGSYDMVSTQGDLRFNVTIPQFELVYNQAIH